MLLHVPKNFQDLALTKYDIVSVGACWLRVCFHFSHRGSGLSSMGAVTTLELVGMPLPVTVQRQNSIYDILGRGEG